MKQGLINIYILIIATGTLQAQDSLKTLSATQVTEIVKRFHPVARQADLFVEKAKADLTISRGLFDPTLENTNARKTFDGTEYYYYNRPELTAERFICSPFSDDAKARLYKTGDLCRYLPDGNIEYLVRMDQQVKIRGFRIELGEIETVLGTHPNVKGVVVSAREDQPGEKYLAAYLIVRESPGPSVAELRAFLAAKLPDYMIPRVFMEIQALPMGPTGKLDRRALPAPEAGLRPGVERVVPRTENERKLAAIWEDVLGVKDVSVDDNLFDLGGHSLLALRLTARINKAFQCDLPLLALFQHPTVKDLACLLDASDTPAKQKGLVWLQEGTGAELFLIGFQGGLSLYSFARLLKTDLSVYGSLAPLPRLGLLSEAERRKVSTIEDLAGAHAQLIRNHMGSRPCLVAGHCFGGILAFEVAQQLKRSGAPVAGVLMLDTWMKQPPKGMIIKAWLRTHIRNTFKHGKRYLFNKLRTRITVERRRLVNRMTAVDYDPEVDRVYRTALGRYRPQPFDLRGVLLLPEDDWAASAFRQQDPSLGAALFFKNGLKVVNVPGDHVSMLKDSNLQSLADAFALCAHELCLSDEPK